MTEETAAYIWERMLDNVQRYGPKYWCQDIDVSMDDYLLFCENVDTMIQETDWDKEKTK